MSVRRAATYHIDAHELVGERLRVDGYLARTGVQTYTDGDAERREYRDPVEVFDEASTTSMRAMPVTVQHPRGMVTGSTWRRDAVGHVGDDVRPADDGQHLEATLWIHDGRAIQRVQAGELRELSVGYLARLDETPGVTPEGEHYDARQTQIRGNHVALLRQGQARGGPTVALRLDSQGDQPWGDPVEMKQKIQVGDLTFEVDAADTSLQGAITQEIQRNETLTKERDELQAKLDATSKEHGEIKAELDKRLDAERAAARAELVKAAHGIAPDLKFADGDNDTEIRRATLDSLGIDTAGKSDGYIEARFELALEKSDAPQNISRPRPNRAPRQDDNDAITDEQRATSSIDAGIRYLGGL